MASTTIISAAQTSSVLLDALGEDLVVTGNGGIIVNLPSGLCVDASANVTGRTINVNGVLHNTTGGAIKVGTSTANTGSNIVFGSGADILAGAIAVEVNGTGINFLNAGTVASLGDYALKASAASSTFVNTGSISSIDHAALLMNGLVGEMINSGTIAKLSGGTFDTAAVIEMNGISTFVNNGTLSAESVNDSLVSFLGSGNMFFTNNGTARGSLVLTTGVSVENNGLLNGNVTVTGNSVVFANTGVITGSITCGTETDSLDLRGGYVRGVVLGGGGDDMYVIDKRTDAEIKDTSGIDTIAVNFSFQLGRDFERLLLKGRGDFTGTGNKSDNLLTGNTGDNILKGLGGADTLQGGEGSDILIGGTKTDGEIDTFVFTSASDRDTVRGFQATTAKHDILDLSDFTLNTSFGVFKTDHMKQVGENVEITMGVDNVLIIEDVKISALKASLFIFDV